MSFLPKDYKEVSGKPYLRPSKEPITFRALGTSEDGGVITGNELWVTTEKGESKPVRIPLQNSFSAAVLSRARVRPEDGSKETPKVFWAMKVWNPANRRVEILSINQKGVRAAIQSLVNNPKWGDPREYDITVERTETNGKVEYLTTPNPKEKLDEETLKLAKLGAMQIDLDALFATEDNPYGGDPFAPKEVDLEKIDELPF